MWWPASKMVTTDPCFLVFTPFRTILPHGIRNGFCDKQNMVEVMMCVSWGKIIKSIVVSALVSWIVHPGKASHHVERAFELPYRKTHVERNKDLPTKANAKLSFMWMSQTGTGSSSPTQTFRWLQSWLTSNFNFMRYLSQHCTAMLLWKTWPAYVVRDNKLLLFKPLNVKSNL